MRMAINNQARSSTHKEFDVVRYNEVFIALGQAERSLAIDAHAVERLDLVLTELARPNARLRNIPIEPAAEMFLQDSGSLAAESRLEDLVLLIDFATTDDFDSLASTRAFAFTDDYGIGEQHAVEGLSAELAMEDLASSLLVSLERCRPILSEPVDPIIELIAADFRDRCVEIAAKLEAVLASEAQSFYGRYRAPLRQVQAVTIDARGLESLPKFLEFLPALDALTITTPPLNGVSPEELRRLRALRHLDVSDGAVDLEGILKSNELKHVQLSGCELTPPQVSLTSAELVELFLVECETFRIESATLPILETIQIVRGLENETLELDAPNLSHIAIEHCDLIELPRCDGSTLKTASFNGTTLPEVLFESIHEPYMSLRELDVSMTTIQSFGVGFAELSDLESLDISYTSMEFLPVEIGLLDSLRVLYYDGIELDDYVATAASLGLYDLKQFLRAFGNSPSECRVAKLVVVGEGNIGKSSLIAALRGEPFVENRETTHGICQVRIPFAAPNDDPVGDLVAWDFGGQEVYRVTHPFFFSRDALYIVAWHPRDGVEQSGIIFWLDAIRYRVGLDACKIFLVSTYAIEGRRTLMDFEATGFQYYPAIEGRFDVDNSTSQGVADLQTALSEQMQALDHFGEPVPERWLSIADELRTEGASYMPLADFVSAAEEHGVVGDARSCARFLHLLGEVLFFDESDGLAPVVVLDPEVLARAVSYLLEHKDIKRAGGFVSYEHLSTIWNESDAELASSPDSFNMLTTLMRRFDVAYEMDNTEGRTGLLISELLPVNRPLGLPWERDTALEAGHSRVSMIFKFRVPPLGLVPWLIVRNAHYLTPHQWLRGALFRHPGHKAECLVDLDQDETTLYLEARGEYPLELFATLKSDIEALLNERWPYLPFDSVIPCPSTPEFGYCTGEFGFDYVREALQRDRSHTDCRSCHSDVDLSSLLYGLVPVGSTIDRIFQRLDDIHSQQIESWKVGAELTQSLRHLREEITPEFAHVPTMISIRQLESRRLSAAKGQRWSVQLWCEHPTCPHPVGEPYETRLAPEWLSQALPALRLTAKILRLVPLANSGIEAFVDDKTWEKIDESLAVVEELSTLATSSSAPEISTEIPIRRGSKKVAELVSRLDDEESDDRFRGLNRTIVPGRPTMWLCDEHASELHALTRKAAGPD